MQHPQKGSLSRILLTIIAIAAVVIFIQSKTDIGQPKPFLGTVRITEVSSADTSKEVADAKYHLSTWHRGGRVDSPTYTVETTRGEPFWKCEVRRNGSATPVKGVTLNSVGCSGLYSNGTDKNIVINAGNMQGESKTRAYWLEGDESNYISDFGDTDMRALELVYEPKGGFWYG